MCNFRRIAALVTLGCVAHASIAHAQFANRARLGAMPNGESAVVVSEAASEVPQAVANRYGSQASNDAWSSPSTPMAGRADTAIIPVVKQTDPAKYTTAGALLGLVGSVAYAAYDLHQCAADTHPSNGIPACLGFDVVAPLMVIGGTFVGGVAGLIVGVVRRSYE